MWWQRRKAIFLFARSVVKLSKQSNELTGDIDHSIPEYPSYNPLDYTRCQICPKFDYLQELAKKKGKEINEVVFIEHFPPTKMVNGPHTTVFVQPDQKLMLVGEAPGAMEERKLRPFIGKSGTILKNAVVRLLDGHVIRILISNVVKCRCIGQPDLPTVEACKGGLAKEVDLFNPDLIIGLGRTAMHVLTGKGYEHMLKHNRNKAFTYRGCDVRITYHPAAALRHTSYRISMNQDLRRYLDEYFKR